MTYLSFHEWVELHEAGLLTRAGQWINNKFGIGQPRATNTAGVVQNKIASAGFNTEDLLNFKEALVGFYSIIVKYVNYIEAKFPALEYRYAFNRYLAGKEHEKYLGLITWIDNLIRQRKGQVAPLGQKYGTWSPRVDSNRPTGPKPPGKTKVNFRDFEAAKTIINDYIVGIENAQHELMTKANNKENPNTPNILRTLQSIYEEKVDKRKSILVRQFDWLHKKIMALMYQRGIKYGGPTADSSPYEYPPDDTMPKGYSLPASGEWGSEQEAKARAQQKEEEKQRQRSDTLKNRQQATAGRFR